MVCEVAIFAGSTCSSGEAENWQKMLRRGARNISHVRVHDSGERVIIPQALSFLLCWGRANGLSRMVQEHGGARAGRRWC